MGLFGKACQSCGMPLSKDEKGGGSELDGSKSKTYCSRCYHNGSFTAPHMTVEQMQQLVAGKMKEMRMPGFLTKMFLKKIPKLKRWSEAHTNTMSGARH